MARRVRLTAAGFFGRGSVGWIVLCALLGGAALVGYLIDPHVLDWQPALAARQPWRAFSAVAVHWSALHLAANLLGTLLVAALGLAARVPARCGWAWLAAWPLTQIGLLLRPDLAHYGGLSGVLHAGVAVVALHLIVAGRGARRWIGVALIVGLVLKVLGEAPWGPVLRQVAGWDIALAPFAHASGLVTGVVCAFVAEYFDRTLREQAQNTTAK